MHVRPAEPLCHAPLCLRQPPAAEAGAEHGEVQAGRFTSSCVFLVGVADPGFLVGSKGHFKETQFAGCVFFRGGKRKPGDERHARKVFPAKLHPNIQNYVEVPPNKEGAPCPNHQSKSFHFLKSIFVSFPLLVLKGTFHYWK